MMHICISKLTIIGSDNGLSPGRRQAIIWTNARILLIKSLKQTSLKYQSKFKHFHSWKCVWKCCRRIGIHFVAASMCLCCLHRDCYQFYAAWQGNPITVRIQDEEHNELRLTPEYEPYGDISEQSTILCMHHFLFSITNMFLYKHICTTNTCNFTIRTTFTMQQSILQNEN